MEARQCTEEQLSQQEVRRLTCEAMAARRFPPVVQYPEKQRGAPLLSALFSWPVIVWVPECLQASKKPFCAMPSCSCTPRLKEYKQRVVEEVDTKCHLLYTKYQCTGESTGCFSTVSPAYLQREPQLVVHFPYVLTKKYGLSKELMEMVHEGVISPHGLSRTIDNLKRRR
ncbi:hypothetical protein PHYSODRAFT_337932 [Phytophthora sojae]|uniref:Uncharacterized protein n=1 Tax=Phytophthora sojae (strain P6497) TaxID=1094619 RepID=G4ZZI6_PHYSP|nr:hypothetical protein PHYSODRAFT_337932 [Phytophthora sojae]EGZ11186.1 hypothetical protein PHYSODRAFT_337932 [Phytophthora sojae]|eukprot:XP_009533931.1 hypothetical protein PHYSODRAFT_337932 [Phytophthora sojae]